MSTGTQVEVVMPQMGVSVSEGTITRWLKQAGDSVALDEPLLEISTDKVDTEVPSPGEGIVAEIRVQEGETVEVGTVLAVIGAAGAAPAAPAEPAAPLQEETPAAEEAAAPAQPSPAAVPEPVAAAPAEQPAPAAAPPLRPLRPRRRAGTAGVSSHPSSRGSPPSTASTRAPSPGRARAAASRRRTSSRSSSPAPPRRRLLRQQAPAAAPAPAVEPEPAPVEVAAAAAPPAAPPAPPAPAPAAPAPAPAAAAAEPAAPAPAAAGEVEEPMTAMRRGVAEHMRRSLDTSAHVTSAIEVDMSRVVAARDHLKKEYQASYGVNPTYLAFISKAAVETLAEWPWVNGEIRGDKIVTRTFVNLGIAVALEDGKGLIVPVIRNAQDLNLLGMARGIAELAEKARTKKLMPDDVQGGTFTITNPGGFGTFHGTPVISQPQAGILGTYALVKRPWVVQDELGQDVIAIRPMMNITLTYDHRLVDGAYAGGFLRDLRGRLEGWDDGGAA